MSQAEENFHTFGPDVGDKDQNKAESEVESNVGCFELWSETSDVIL
jgi:hypothetical protein